MSNYLIELSVIHITFILGYWLFLRNERQYDKMRFYLIGSTVLSLSIPLLKLPNIFFNSEELMNGAAMRAIALDATTIAPSADTSIWNFDVIVWAYVAISALLLLKLLTGLLYLIYLVRNSDYEKSIDVYIHKARDIKGSFTFFNWILVSDEIDKDQKEFDAILKHEKAHVSLGHTYDLMLFELFKVCFWWLPTSWFSVKEIKKIHEYQADACALKSCNVDQYSSLLISSALKSNGLTLVSSFHDGLILKRLQAIKQEAKNVSLWKFGALGFLCALLVLVFACSEQMDQKTKNIGKEGNTMKAEGEVFTIVEELPEFPGGIDAFYKYVQNEIKYPLQARLTSIEGRVDLQFVVEKDGSLSDIKVIKGIGGGCDSEAERVLQNAPSFKPGKQSGMAVRVRMLMPIIFKLDNDITNNDNSPKGIIVVEKVKLKNGKLKVDASYANGEWSGIVYDEEGDGLPGVNILVKGTTTGTVSDLDGVFKVKAGESNDLYLSFVGYESVRLEAK